MVPVPICASAQNRQVLTSRKIWKGAQISSPELGIYLNIPLPSLECMYFLV